MTLKLSGYAPSSDDAVEFIFEDEQGILTSLKMKPPDVLDMMTRIMPIINAHLKTLPSPVGVEKVFMLPTAAIQVASQLGPDELLLSVQTMMGMKYHFQMKAEFAPQLAEALLQQKDLADKMKHSPKQ